MWQLTSMKQRISSSRFKLWNTGKDQTTCTNPDELRNRGFSVSMKRHLINNSSMALGILLKWEDENTTNELKLSTCILNISVHSARAFYGTQCLHVRYILHIPHELFTLHTTTSNFNLPSTPFTRPNLKNFETAWVLEHFPYSTFNSMAFALALCISNRNFSVIGDILVNLLQNFLKTRNVIKQSHLSLGLIKLKWLCKLCMNFKCTVTLSNFSCNLFGHFAVKQVGYERSCTKNLSSLTAPCTFV